MHVSPLALALVAAGCATGTVARTTPPGSIAPADAAVVVAPPAEVGGPYPWVPDQGDGRYRNPVIFADYSDPDVIRVGDRYYLVASSFTATPALPILRSRDLVNWTIVGHAMQNLPDARYADLQPGAGVWAPALREHAGVFYLFAPLPDEGIYVLTAPSPEGPWTIPRLLVAGRGLIDPCPFWDDDGQAYLIHAYARSRAGIKDRLRLRPMAPDASRLLGEGTIVYSDPARHPTLEGPKLYKRNGWYYILAPAGGVPRGWQVALRSRRIQGPYEDRIVLAQGATPVNGPHQGALVDTPSGQWWFVHFQDAGIYGRVVHLNPVVWQDDWPLMGVATRDGAGREPVLRHTKPDGAPQPTAIPQTSDEFDAPPDQQGRPDPQREDPLSPQWQWHANHGGDWYDLRARPGWLRLRALPLPRGGLAAASHLLLQKLPARTFTAETVVDRAVGDPGIRAGLIVAGESAAALVVERAAAGTGQRVTLRIDDRVVYAAPIADGPVRLRVTMADGGSCRFAFAPGGPPSPRGQTRERESEQAREQPREQAVDVPFTAGPGRWVGATVGIFAAIPTAAPPATRATPSTPVSAGANATADFDYFRFSAAITGVAPAPAPTRASATAEAPPR